MTAPIIENFASTYLDYIKEYGEHFYPDVSTGYWEEEQLYFQTNIHSMFEARLNTEKIQHHFTYDGFINNEDIQNSLLALGLDIDKFWFLLLFIYDYVSTSQTDGFEHAEWPHEKANNFMKELAQALSEGKKVELELLIEGQKRHCHLESPEALSIISNSYKPFENTRSFIRRQFTRDLQSATIAICTFNEIANNFFKTIMPTLELHPQTPLNYTKNISVIISRLVYFTGLTNNKKFLCEGNYPYIKDYLKKYKDFKIERRNNYYCS